MYLKGLFCKVWPKHSIADKIAFSVTHIGLIGIFIFELFVVLPLYYNPFEFWYCLHVIVGMYFLFCVFVNMYNMILTDSTVNSEALQLPSVLRPGWYYCHSCRINSPPRAHHCPICEICVIKRDHHCIFTGNCVGYFNHRYFLCMAIHLWIGCLYTVVFNFEYYNSVLGEFHSSTLVKMFFPMVAWTFGYLSLLQLFITVIAGVTFMALFLFTCLLGFQMYFIFNGQTQFECKKKVKDFRQNPYKDFKLVLGKRWYLALFLPYCHSELPGDGTEFCKDTQDAKDM